MPAPITSALTSPLLSADWLQAQLDRSQSEQDAIANPALVIVDCRFALAHPQQGRTDYEQGHIPGAHYLSLDQDLSAPLPGPPPVEGGRHPLPRPEIFAQKLNQLGVMAQTLIVAYDDSRFAFAARLWWLLRYFGHDRVAVLDGGWKAWQAAGYEVSPAVPEAIPEPRTGTFVPRPRPDLLASRQAVMERSASTPLIDSRSPQRYRGEEEPIDPIAGSIPGAINRFWQGVTDEHGLAKPAEEQAARWGNLAEAETSIVYCGSGVTACVNLLSMAMAGIHNAQLYVGSWSDWCAYLAEENQPESP